MSVIFNVLGFLCTLIGIYEVIVVGGNGVDWITLGAVYGIWAAIKDSKPDPYK